MTEFAELEAKDGIRMTWNVVPGTKQEAATCVVPVAAIYTPLKPIAPVLQYSPLRCRTCRSVLNSFSSVDYASKIWTCPLCYQRNHFPVHHSSISEDNLPAELFPQHTTVEYQLDACGPPPLPPVYLFVVDTCIIEGEMMFLKSALSQAVELLPDDSLIGLITFGTDVQVHELGFGHMPKYYVFKGTKEVTKDRLLDQMGFFANTPRPHSGVIGGLRDGLSSESIARFLMTASECEFVVISILEGLQKDPWHVPADQRAARCTGTALSVAACLLGVCMPGSGARIMAFVGGPSTEGLGSIATKNLSEPVRSHKDVEKSTAALYNEAVKFYEGLSKQLVHQGHVLDLFACALDQVGVAEMKVLVERTGGIVVLAESFGHSVFKDSFRRVFQSNEDLGLSSNGVFEINCSTNIKVQGIIGPCASLGKKGPLCSELVIGQGNTSAWKMCGLDKQTSLCIIFEIAKTDASAAIRQSASNQLYFQFLTYYQHGNGQMRLRATTISRRSVAGPGSLQDLIAGFDQEAATTVIARLVSFKMETEVDFDPVRWIDRQLIRLYSCFGEYKKDTPASFSISPRLSLFPRFIYHLRRSQFVQVFNSSPDETAYFRMLLYRENVMNSVLMIQPSLISYSLNSLPEPALLDITAISADRILLMDSYFAIVIFHGTTITQWRKAGYHNQPEHVLFAQLLKAPHDDANEIIKERFPTPRLVICDQYGSQARFLLAKLNPSITYNSTDPFRAGGNVIYTDDVSFEVFLNYLHRLAVQ